MKIIGLLLTVIGLLGLSGAQGHSEIHRRAGKPATTAGASGPTQQARLLATYGKLPLSFEANQGQTDPEVKFLSRGSGYTLFLTSNEAVLALRKASRRPRNPNSKMEAPHLSPATALLRMRLAGASAEPRVLGLEELPGRSNYFIGNDPKNWQTDVATYAKVRYEDIYPGVDLVYYGNQGQLEYDFMVAPGADPRAIRLRFAEATRRVGQNGRGGLRSLRIDPQGDLVLRIDGGQIRFHKPVVYQTTPDLGPRTPGSRHVVDGRYVLRGEREVGFKVAAYDPKRPLIIDPTMSYSTYLGGSGQDIGRGIAVDANGSAYVTGFTTSSDFPKTDVSSLKGYFNVFVAKLNAAGTKLVYSTYLGGSVYDFAGGTAVDSSGNAYVTGTTYSTDFPTTANAFQGSTNASRVPDAFVTKLNASGALLYSTYLGGSLGEDGRAIAVDASGNPFVTGITISGDFPTANAFQSANRGGDDVFVTKLNASGSGLVYSTYLGGSGNDDVFGIAVDSSGNAYVTGSTDSNNFPTANAIPVANSGGREAFVTKLNAAGSGLLYSTYLAGSGDDEAFGIAVDTSGNAYVTGSTTSGDFPTANPFQAANAGGTDAFVTKLNASGSGLVYSTYLGGSGEDDGVGIAVDSSGNAYVTGDSSSSNFPTKNLIQAAYGGGWTDLFVTKLNAAGSALIYSSYLGGSDQDFGRAIAVDSSGSAYLIGYTASTNFPTAPIANPLQAANAGGGFDAFVVKVSGAAAADPPPPADATPPAVSISANPSILWPPNGEMVPVRISGTITDSGSGVDPSRTAYKVIDDYGICQPSGPMTLGSGGGYSLIIMLQASRKGQDLGGRKYTIMVSAKDIAGNPASASIVVTVPHDQGR